MDQCGEKPPLRRREQVGQLREGNAVSAAAVEQVTGRSAEIVRHEGTVRRKLQYVSLRICDPREVGNGIINERNATEAHRIDTAFADQHESEWAVRIGGDR